MVDQKRVVVIGAGIAGLFVAQQLRKRKDAHVVLISDKDYFLFLPRLPELFSGSVQQQKYVLPLKDVWKGELIVDKANLVNPQERSIVLNSGTKTNYDLLVIALGSQVNYFGTPGNQYSYNFYNKDDADRLREHMDRLLEADEQQGTHTFAVVGGGPTGVEVAYKLSSMVKTKRPAAKVLLIEAGPQILKVVPPKVAQAAQQTLTERGVEIHTACSVKNITPMSIEVQTADGNKETIPCYTTVWAAGSKPQQIAITGVELTPKGEIPVQPSMRAVTDPNIFALGDCAATGTPKTAQAAFQQAAVAAENIGRLLDGKALVPFEYKEKGTVIGLDKDTVGIFYGKYLKGFIAQQLRDKYYAFRIADYK